MSAIKFGVYVDHLRLDPRRGLHRAAEMGFHGVLLDATQGPLRPQELSHSGRRDLARTVSGLGLQIAGLGSDPGGKRFGDPKTVERRIDETRRIIDLAADLRVPVVATAMGRLAERPDDPAPGLVREALAVLGGYAERAGIMLGVETADADPACLAKLLHEMDCPALKVNYDPASLIMAGCDPLAGMGAVADQIVLAQVHDAVRSTPEGAREVPLGQGNLPLEEYLAFLDEAGYRGYPILQRREGQNPGADLLAAKTMIERLLSH